jgi:hypothetical protein
MVAAVPRHQGRYHFAYVLAEDEKHRAGDWDDSAEFGLFDRRFRKLNESVSVALAGSEAALAQGDITAIRDALDRLLETQGIQLDPFSESFRKPGGQRHGSRVIAE